MTNSIPANSISLPDAARSLGISPEALLSRLLRRGQALRIGSRWYANIDHIEVIRDQRASRNRDDGAASVAA